MSDKFQEVDITIGYGMLDVASEGYEYTVSVDVRTPDSDGWNLAASLEARIEQAVKQWLEEDAPKGTKTTLVGAHS